MDEPTGVDNLKEKIEHYRPSSDTIELVRQTPILLLVGVSGAGKDSIKQRLLATGNYHHIVSHTTRPPRRNHGVLEQDGVDYHFIDTDEAHNMLYQGAFIEAKFYSGNIYGTSVAEVQKAHDEGKIAVTDIEVQGVAEYEEISPDVKAVFLLPPSYQIWQERLQRRYDGTIHQHDLHKRMYTAEIELQEALKKDYFCFVINDDLEQALKAVDACAHGENQKTDDAKMARQVADDLLKHLQASL